MNDRPGLKEVAKENAAEFVSDAEFRTRQMASDKAENAQDAAAEKIDEAAEAAAAAGAQFDPQPESVHAGDVYFVALGVDVGEAHSAAGASGEGRGLAKLH